ncbi:ribonuclease, partial [Bacillus licheniformis]
NADAFQLFSFPVQSSAPADYYEHALGTTGEALKRAPHDTIDDHRELFYSEVWEAPKATDEDPANRNNVILINFRQSLSKQANGGQTGDW